MRPAHTSEDVPTDTAITVDVFERDDCDFDPREHIVLTRREAGDGIPQAPEGDRSIPLQWELLYEGAEIAPDMRWVPESNDLWHGTLEEELEEDEIYDLWALPVRSDTGGECSGHRLIRNTFQTSDAAIEYVPSTLDFDEQDGTCRDRRLGEGEWVRDAQFRTIVTADPGHTILVLSAEGDVDTTDSGFIGGASLGSTQLPLAVQASWTLATLDPWQRLSETTDYSRTHECEPLTETEITAFEDAIEADRIAAEERRRMQEEEAAARRASSEGCSVGASSSTSIPTLSWMLIGAALLLRRRLR